MAAQVVMDFTHGIVRVEHDSWTVPGLSQCDAILAYLQAGYAISPALAYDLFGTLACHSRISELRGRGHRIECRIVRRGGKQFGQYTLERAA